VTALLLDGHNLLYRSFTSLPPAIVAADGRPIHAVHGLVSTIQRLSRELEAEHVVAAFDVPDVPTFRHQLYAAYQGQRGPLGGENAEDFARQVGIAQRVLPGMGVPAMTAPGYEADDIMGTLATRVARRGERAIVVSTDRDLLQLVGPGIEVLSPSNPPIHARESNDVVARLGVPPGGVTTFKALAGDASDNIPGVRGIGAKTAADLVNRFGSLESLYESLSALPGRVSLALESGREAAFLFRTIVTVATDLELPLDCDNLPTLVYAADARVGSILKDLGYGRPAPA